MVKYNVGNVDPNSLHLGTYYIRTYVPIRGKDANKPQVSVFQVKKKNDNEFYWSKVKNDQLIGGRPPPLSARLLNLTPHKAAIDAYQAGNDVMLVTAWDENGENPTSEFVLRRRSEGNENYVYYWSTRRTGADSVKIPTRRAPTKKHKKPAKKAQE